MKERTELESQMGDSERTCAGWPEDEERRDKKSVDHAEERK